MDQIAIALLGTTAVWLSQDERDSRRRWACIFGLLSQPFWFWSAWHAQQWGIFALCFIYAACWVRGVRTYWM